MTNHAATAGIPDDEDAAVAVTPPITFGRVAALDGLRGIAAFVVVFHHAGQAYLSVTGRTPDVSPLWSAVDRAGHSAVMLFFVLSGFVLMLNFQ